MSDFISRKAAIEAVEKESQVDGAYGYMDTKSIVDLLDDLPSAQPERNRGRWIRMYANRPKQYTRICSECGEISWFCGIGDYNYCPWCGTRMKGDEEDERS